MRPEKTRKAATVTATRKKSSPRPPAKKKPPGAAAAPSRVRRGNADDHEQMRRRCLAAADELFASGGVEAVTMRAVAAKVGVSAMAPYRYFFDKADLLGGLWQSVVHQLCGEMRRAIDAQHGGRARQRASIDSFLGYWERNPDHYRLLYMTDQTSRAGVTERATASPVYAEILEVVRGVTQDLAAEIGAPMTHAKIAGDLRFAMLLGYLHATLINHRYPWGSQRTLRPAFIEEVIGVVERCLLHGPLSAGR